VGRDMVERLVGILVEYYRCLGCVHTCTHAHTQHEHGHYTHCLWKFRHAGEPYIGMTGFMVIVRNSFFYSNLSESKKRKCVFSQEAWEDLKATHCLASAEDTARKLSHLQSWSLEYIWKDWATTRTGEGSWCCFETTTLIVCNFRSSSLFLCINHPLSLLHTHRANTLNVIHLLQRKT